MQLQGQLRLTTLGDLLGSLSREGVTGTLELTEQKGPAAGRSHCLHLVRGQIVQVDSSAIRTPLGEVLAEKGWLDPCRLPQVLAQAKSASLPLGQLLVTAGLLPGEIVVEALRTQIQRRLDALFGLEDARVAFRVVQRRRRELDVTKPLGPEEFLVGRPRARDRGNSSGTAAVVGGELALRQRDLRLLGLGPMADETAIRTAFRRLARTLHPDLHPTAHPAHADTLKRKFAEVSAAYHRLAG